MLSLASVMLSVGRMTRPNSISWGTTRDTVSTGIAKPTPVLLPLLVKMAVFRPMSWPELSSSGPPLLPGLMAASVWMPPLIRLPTALCTLRSSPLTTPEVRVWSKPNGLPMASTLWPTRTPELLPRGTGTSSPAGAAMRSTARSLPLSAPTRSATKAWLLPSRPSSVTRATLARRRPARPSRPLAAASTLASTW